MNYHPIYSLTLFGLILLFSCSKEELKTDENIAIVEESISVGIGNSFTYSLGHFSSEGALEISQQANHFETSEITTGNSGMEFLYKPITGFIGKDYVEITQTYGNNISGATIFKLSINVTSD